jgi:hypothetical protein
MRGLLIGLVLALLLPTSLLAQPASRPLGQVRVPGPPIERVMPEPQDAAILIAGVLAVQQDGMALTAAQTTAYNNLRSGAGLDRADMAALAALPPRDRMAARIIGHLQTVLTTPVQ